MSDKRIASVIVEHCLSCPFVVYHDDDDGYTLSVTCSKLDDDIEVPTSGISLYCPLEFA